MRLIIIKSYKITRPFIEWLNDQLCKLLIANVKLKELERLTMSYNQLFESSINLNSIYVKIIQNIEVFETQTSFIFKINDKDFKLNYFMKFINYGNMNVNGYPIFSNTFNHILENIDLYLEKYHLIGGI